MKEMKTVQETKSKKKEPLPDVIEQLEASLKAMKEGRYKKAL